MITIRQATPRDIRPALALALRVFTEYDAPGFLPEALVKFTAEIHATIENPAMYLAGERLLFVALDGKKVVGVVAERWGNGHISMVFVDGAYHRRGIATRLLHRTICEMKLRGYDKITLFSSPYGLPFYLHFGFKATDVEQQKDGFVFTPMAYTPGEIWDVLDADGNKTGRYHERGRKMATGDYHLVVHVWKHNGRGEWLIDRRALERGTSIDGKWETTGGSALAGDDSLTAALRETKEELGLALDPQKGKMFCRVMRHGKDGRTWFQDAWVFEHDCLIEAVKFQENETCDAKWATAGQIREMIKRGEFLDEWFYPYFDDMMKTFEHIK